VNAGLSQPSRKWNTGTECNSLFVNFRHFGILWCFIIAISIFSTGCSGKSDIQPDGFMTLDLMNKLVPEESASLDNQFYRHMQVVRRGDRRDSMILVAPVAVRASLHGISGQMILKGFATPLFNIGDGIQLNIFLKRDGGGLQLIGSRYFDAGRNGEDRNWIPIAISLNPDKNDQLEIEVSTGPQGDSTADWLALSSMCLIRTNAGAVTAR
jgi:hypothetical protein